MIGAQGSGKSTWIKKNNNNNFEILSRDAIVEQIAIENNLLYHETFQNEQLQKQVDIIYNEKFQNLLNKQSFFIDKMNLTVNSRKKVLSQLKNYNKIGVCFNLPIETLWSRCEQRAAIDKKYISYNILKKSYDSFEEPSLDEFDFILKYF